jgi:hypothetical protein
VNDQIKQHLDAEADYNSRGYFTDLPLERIVISEPDGVAGVEAARSALPDPDTFVAPHAGLSELLDARSQQR